MRVYAQVGRVPSLFKTSHLVPSKA